MIHTLLALLIFEFVFRTILEIREARRFSRWNRFAFIRVIPFLNDFVPFPENRNLIEKNNPFISFHEEAHKKQHHQISRLLVKVVLFFFCVLVLFYTLDHFKASLIEIIIFIHLALFLLQIPYHYYVWQQEFEADIYACHKTSITQAKKQLRQLVNDEIPYSFLFALLYREHPPASLRLKKVLLKCT